MGTWRTNETRRHSELDALAEEPLKHHLRCEVSWTLHPFSPLQLLSLAVSLPLVPLRKPAGDN